MGRRTMRRRVMKGWRYRMGDCDIESLPTPFLSLPFDAALWGRAKRGSASISHCNAGGEADNHSDKKGLNLDI